MRGLTCSHRHMQAPTLCSLPPALQTPARRLPGYGGKAAEAFERREGWMWNVTGSRGRRQQCLRVCLQLCTLGRQQLNVIAELVTGTQLLLLWLPAPLLQTASKRPQTCSGTAKPTWSSFLA